MRKQVITRSEDKVNIVILANDAERIQVKGISRCHDEDTYNEEFGIQLANTRAWLKYYEAIEKRAGEELDWEEEMVKWHQDEIARITKMKENAQVKRAEIQEEYDKMLETV